MLECIKLNILFYFVVKYYFFPKHISCLINWWNNYCCNNNNSICVCRLIIYICSSVKKKIHNVSENADNDFWMLRICILSRYICRRNILSLKSISKGCHRKFKLQEKIFTENENGIQRKGFDNKKCQRMIFALLITD